MMRISTGVCICSDIKIKVEKRMNEMEESKY